MASESFELRPTEFEKLMFHAHMALPFSGRENEDIHRVLHVSGNAGAEATNVLQTTIGAILQGGKVPTLSPDQMLDLVLTSYFCHAVVSSLGNEDSFKAYSDAVSSQIEEFFARLNINQGACQSMVRQRRLTDFFRDCGESGISNAAQIYHGLSLLKTSPEDSFIQGHYETIRGSVSQSFFYHAIADFIARGMISPFYSSFSYRNGTQKNRLEEYLKEKHYPIPQHQ